MDRGTIRGTIFLVRLEHLENYVLACTLHSLFVHRICAIPYPGLRLQCYWGQTHCTTGWCILSSKQRPHTGYEGRLRETCLGFLTLASFLTALHCEWRTAPCNRIESVILSSPTSSSSVMLKGAAQLSPHLKIAPSVPLKARGAASR